MPPNDGGAFMVTGTHRKALRRGAALLSGGVAVLYLGVFFIQLPHLHEPENPAPVFIPLALVYVVGAILLTLLDVPWVQWLGAAVQVILIGLLVWIVVGSYTHEGVEFFVDMLWLVLTITAAQVLILGLLVKLALGSRSCA